MSAKIKNVYPQISSFEGIAQAERDTRAGKRYTREKLEFFAHYEENIHYLVDCLKNHAPPPDSYRFFFIYEPKLRKVIFSDYYTKIIMRSCYNVLNPLICKGFITDTYSCVEGRGQLFAMQRVSQWVNYAGRQSERWYYLKMDAEKFFYRIDHQVLADILRRKIHDMETVNLLLHYILHASRPFGLPLGSKGPHDISDDEMLWDVGIAIGGGLSHMYGNMYLDPFDQMIKRTERVRMYGRYMDDMVILSPDKDDLHRLLRVSREYLGDVLRLNLNRKTVIRPLSQGLEFVGYRFWPGHVSLRKSTALRMKRHLRGIERGYRDGTVTFEKAHQAVASYKAMMKHIDCAELEKHIFDNFVLTHAKEDGCAGSEPFGTA